MMTREPGGSRIAERIREIILDGKNTAMCDECEALLYAASRVQLLKEKLIPALEAGKLVICDRYVHSSLAYQGIARGLGEEYVADINSFALENCPPDLTIFTDIPPERAERKHGADKNDRMEQLGMEFHKRFTPATARSSADMRTLRPWTVPARSGRRATRYGICSLSVA